MEKVRCVKIARQAFDSLEEKDANAMYFVNTSGDFGPESLETGGEIWLGDKLISVGSRVYYAECATAAATTAKVATVVGSEHFVAAAGVMVIVKFANKNTGAVASLTLNVNSTGAHAIKKIYTTSGISNLTNAAEIAANSFIPFIFTGTYWLVAGLDYNTNTQRTLATKDPMMDGVAAVGTSSSVARQDHVHPTDTSRAADADVIHKTGNETIDGVKTFSNSASACEFRMDGGEGSDGYDHELRVTFSENNDEVFELGLNDRYHNANHKVKVSGVAVPSANYDAANKKYVDETVSDVVDETINDTVFVERADIRTSLLALTHRNGRLITDGTWFGSGKHVMYPISSTSPFPYVMITGNNQQYTYAGLLSADDTGSGLTPGDDASLVGGVVSVPQNKTVLIPIPDSAVYLCVCAIDDNCWPSDVKVMDIPCMVHRTGNETIEGNKTFTGNVVIDNRAINQGLSEIKLKGDDSAEGHTESITLMADEYSYSDLPRLTIGSYSGNEVVLSNVADPELDTDAASKHYVDNFSNKTRFGGVAGFNGLFLYSLCLLDSKGRMSSFTTTGGNGTKTVNTGSDSDIYFPMAGLSVNIFWGEGNITAGSSYSSKLFATRGIVDVRYTSLRGNNLPSTWANVGDPVYLAAHWVGVIGTVSPVIIITPAPFVMVNQSDPYTYPDVPRDILISKKMMEEYGVYLVHESTDPGVPDDYEFPYETMDGSLFNHLSNGYIYLGRMVSTYELMLEEVNPLLVYKPQHTTSNHTVDQHYFLDLNLHLLLKHID